MHDRDVSGVRSANSSSQSSLPSADYHQLIALPFETAAESARPRTGKTGKGGGRKIIVDRWAYGANNRSARPDITISRLLCIYNNYNNFINVYIQINCRLAPAHMLV